MKQFIWLFLSLFLIACDQAAIDQQQATDTPETATNETPEGTIQPDWAKNATIYEVNLRQYTPEGTINAFAESLPRLKEMGVDILWFMPVHPISEERRKGTLGSYYAIDDYRAINPDYGTMEDFDNMVAKIHELGMYLILDWVPNHTGWGHSWITEHPEYYTKNAAGEITDPIKEDGTSWGWTDVADLNYDSPDMRKAMIAELEFWVREHDIDGYRCDVASEVPFDFWDEAVPPLRAMKNVFMLAEAEKMEHLNSRNFAMNYGWEFHHAMNDVAKGDKKAHYLDTVLNKKKEEIEYGYQMQFTTNHDENSWNGTVFERLGDGHLTFAVLASTVPGMPLVYSGQEAPVEKRLEFFEKDAIEWNDYQYHDFYKTLLNFKKENPALWNGEHGGELVKVSTDKDDQVYLFTRKKGENEILVMLNLSGESQEATFTLEGQYTNIFDGATMTFKGTNNQTLGPWEYKLMSRL
ncbi:MAG: alpha-amylase family glycosyl hydrolase [Bacteroidota bacterium]